MSDDAQQRFVNALTLHGCDVRSHGDYLMAQCPAHSDDKPSLAIRERKDKTGVVIFCHAGCSYRDVLAALDMTDQDLFDEPLVRSVFDPIRTYVYAGGRRNHRGMSADGTKTFWQEGAEDRSLFGITGIAATGVVYMCEGEKAAELLAALKYNAVATGGAQRNCDLTPLAGRDVAIIADRDAAGYQWAIRQMKALMGSAISVKVVQAKPNIPKADVVEHINAGFDMDELELVVDPGQMNGKAEQDPKDLHLLAVERKAYELQIVDEARALWKRQRAALMGQQPPTMVSLSDFLATPDEETQFRINNILPVGGRALLAAQYKAGKTSLIANLLRSLVDGHPFLGSFESNMVERVLLIDTELDERMLRKWLRDQSIRNTNSINVMSLRGRLSTFNIVDDRTRAEWVQRISGAQIILLDCLRPCLDAIGLSEDKEAGIFLVAFDALCKECGTEEAVVVHHMGHSQERSRGDSRLLDWPDVLWKIVRDTDEEGEDIETGDRFFSAVGRDVNVPESQLDWQPDTRALMICGGNRIDKKARTVFEDIIAILVNPDHVDGLGRNELVKKLRTYGHSLHIARAALQRAVLDGLLIVKKGPRNSNVHILNPSHLN